MIQQDKRVVMRTPHYKIEKCWVGEWKYFLDRINGHNICNGSYHYCLKELDKQRELDNLHDRLKANLIEIWRK